MCASIDCSVRCSCQGCSLYKIARFSTKSFFLIQIRLDHEKKLLSIKWWRRKVVDFKVGETQLNLWPYLHCRSDEIDHRDHEPVFEARTPSRVAHGNGQRTWPLAPWEHPQRARLMCEERREMRSVCQRRLGRWKTITAPWSTQKEKQLFAQWCLVQDCKFLPLEMTRQHAIF